MKIKITSGNLFIASTILITIFVLYLGAYMIFLDPYEPMGYALLGFVIAMIILFYLHFSGRLSEKPDYVTMTSVTCKNCGRTATLLPLIEEYVSTHGMPSKTAYDDHCPFCGRKY